MKRIRSTTLFAVCLGLMAPSAALGAGGPVPPVQGSDIGVPGSPYTYAAFAAGSGTLVKQTKVGADTTASSLRVPGRYGVPAVDFSGSTTGLSADGRTLVLAELFGNRTPRWTRLLVLSTTPRLAVRNAIVLRGWSTVDAISPDGRWLYLIHYTAANVLTYEVRAYDLRTHRLLAKPVVDPRERDEAMTGIPATRVMSAGGRWAYTLYIRPSGVPFIHALDTAHRRAACIDLPSLSNVDLGSVALRLPPGGGMLQVVDSAGVTQAQINTRTFAVTRGGEPSTTATVAATTRPAARESRPARNRDTRGGVPWALIVLVIAVLGALAAAVVIPARANRAPSEIHVVVDGDNMTISSTPPAGS